MVNEKKNNFTNLKKALENMGGKRNLKKNLNVFFVNSLTNYLINLGYVYDSVKKVFGEKVVIGGSTAILLHLLEEKSRNFDLSKLNDDELKKIVSVLNIEDKDSFRIKSNFNLLVIPNKENKSINKLSINVNNKNIEYNLKNNSRTFETKEKNCPLFDIEFKTIINYKKINNFDVNSLETLYDIYNDINDNNKLEVLKELIQNNSVSIDMQHKVKKDEI